MLSVASRCAAQWDLNLEQPLVSTITPGMASLAIEQLALSDSQRKSFSEIVATHAAKLAEFADAWRDRLRRLDRATVDPSLQATERWNLESQAFRAGREVADRQAAMDQGVINQLRSLLASEQLSRWNDFLMRWLDARGAGSSSATTCEARVQLLELLDQFAAATSRGSPECSHVLADAAHAYAAEACPIRDALISASIRMARESRDELEARAEVREDGTVRIGDFRNASDKAKYGKWPKQVEKCSMKLGQLNVACLDRLERDLQLTVFHDLAWSFWVKAFPSEVAVREAREWVRFVSLARELVPVAGENIEAIEEVLAKGDKKLLGHMRAIAAIANARPEPGEPAALHAAKIRSEGEAFAAERLSIQQSAMVLFPESAQQKMRAASAKLRD